MPRIRISFALSNTTKPKNELTHSQVRNVLMRCHFFISIFVCMRVCVCQNNHLQWKRVSAHRCWRCNAIKLMMCLICTQNLSMCSEISRPIQMPTSIDKTLEDVCLLSVYWRFTHVIDVSYTTCTQRIRHGYDVAWAAPTLIYVCAGVWSDKVDIGQYHLTSSY